MLVDLVGKAGIAPRCRYDLVKLDKSCFGEQPTRPAFSGDEMVIDRFHGLTRGQPGQF